MTYTEFNFSRNPAAESYTPVSFSLKKGEQALIYVDARGQSVRLDTLVENNTTTAGSIIGKDRTFHEALGFINWVSNKLRTANTRKTHPEYDPEHYAF